MTENELIEKLAKAACEADGDDPHEFVKTDVQSYIYDGMGQLIETNYNSDAGQLKFTFSLPEARRFLAMMKAYEEAQAVTPKEGA